MASIVTASATVFNLLHVTVFYHNKFKLVAFICKFQSHVRAHKLESYISNQHCYTIWRIFVQINWFFTIKFSSLNFDQIDIDLIIPLCLCGIIDSIIHTRLTWNYLCIFYNSCMIFVVFQFKFCVYFWINTLYNQQLFCQMVFNYKKN